MVLSIFNEVKIFKPWYAEDPDFPEGGVYAAHIHLQNPPLERKPEKDFKDLLAEYYQWMRENPDRTTREALRNYQREAERERTWAIKKSIRHGVPEPPFLDADKDFIRHLMLHLAQESEKQRIELDSRVCLLKEKDSLLEGVIEEIDRGKGLLNDLPSFEVERIMSESHLTYVLEAWLGLFGDLLIESQPLVTLEPSIFNLLKDGFSEASEGGKSAPMVFQEVDFPDLSDHSLNEVLSLKNKNPLKNRLENFLKGLHEPKVQSKTPPAEENEPPEQGKEVVHSPNRLHLQMIFCDLPETENLTNLSTIIKDMNRRVIIHIGKAI